MLHLHCGLNFYKFEISSEFFSYFRKEFEEICKEILYEATKKILELIVSDIRYDRKRCLANLNLFYDYCMDSLAILFFIINYLLTFI